MPDAQPFDTNPATGERIRWLRRAAETGGELARLEMWTAPGGGVRGTHVHARSEERFEVLAGRLVLESDGEQRVLLPGERATVPAGTPHRWRNGSPEELHMIIELDRPGRFEHMIEAAFAAGRDGGFDARGRMGPRAAAALVRRYPDEIAPPWRRWLQRLVIPPLALAGRRAVALLVVAAALVAFPAVASASSRPVKYAGRTSSGHPVTFKIAGGRMYELRAGVRVSCVPMQGGSTPTGGTDIFGFDGYVPLKRHVRFKFKAKTALWFNEVTKTHDIWITRRGSTIRGRLRLQFSFLVPKFTPGTFTIYSCLGGATFKARPKQ